MNEVTVNMDNLTTEEREQLLALVKKGNKKPFEVWKPTRDYECYILQGNGRPSACCGLKITLDYYTQGRVFETREQAEFHAEQERILTQYKRLAEESWAGEAIDWRNDIWNKYYLFVYYGVLQFDASCAISHQGVIYFKTEESLDAAIKTIGEENIIKYLF